VPCADPFAEADEDTGETKQSQNYIHIRIQRTLPLPIPNHILNSPPRSRANNYIFQSGTDARP